MDFFAYQEAGGARALFAEDVPILNTLDLSEPGILVGADQALAKYFRWAKSYPRMTMNELRRAAERGVHTG